MAQDDLLRTPARREGAAVIDAGERQYMLRVFNWMALAVAFTGAVTLFVSSSPALLALAQGTFLFGFIAILALGFLAPRIIATKSLALAQGVFWAYAALWGFFIAPAIYYYLATDPGLVARAFFVTAAAFAGISLYGYTTKRDLTRIGTFAAMMIWGVLVAIIVNLFLGSSGLDFLISLAVVGLFSVVTAWEVQSIRDDYHALEGAGETALARRSIMGALQLYGSFVVLFIHILNILAHLRR